MSYINIYSSLASGVYYRGVIICQQVTGLGIVIGRFPCTYCDSPYPAEPL